MDEDKKIDFEKKIQLLNEENKAVDEAISSKQENIHKEAENIRGLKKLKNNLSFTSDMYSNVPKEKLSNIDDSEYIRFIQPLDNIIDIGRIAFPIRDQSREMFAGLKDQYIIVGTTNTVSTSGAMSVASISNMHPDYFPKREEFIYKYKVTDETEININYIKGHLKKISPDISKDFDYFITKYHAFKRDKSQYQDLIGSRSMIFYAFIFEFSKNNFGVELPRKEAIKKFVFGNSPYDNSVEPIIDNADKLYRELSNQDSNRGQSVKVGNVDENYIDDLFRRIIAVMASMLQLREKYYS